MRIGYIHAMKGSLLSLIAFSTLALLVPGQGESTHVELLLTVSTFLFAILAGFYMTRVNQRYDMVRELAAEEDADWLTFYESSKFFEPEFHDNLRELIDEYYVNMMDHDNMKYYKRTRPAFRKIHAALHLVKNKETPVISYMVELLANLEKTRNKISVVAAEQLRPGQWGTLIILASVILFCLYYLRQPSLYSTITTVLLGTVLMMILFVIRDLTHFRLGGQLVAYESGQETFEYLGKPRYYNQQMLEDGSVTIPHTVKRYRVGRHAPGTKEMVIELVTVEEYSPGK